MNKKLPPNYRYLMVEVGHGTGHGDEVWSLGLQKWETRTFRRGIWPFRRNVPVTRWWTVEVFGFGIPGPNEYRQAFYSAWVRHRHETGGADA